MSGGRPCALALSLPICPLWWNVLSLTFLVLFSSSPSWKQKYGTGSWLFLCSVKGAFAREKRAPASSRLKLAFISRPLTKATSSFPRWCLWEMLVGGDGKCKGVAPMGVRPLWLLSPQLCWGTGPRSWSCGPSTSGPSGLGCR